MNNDKWNYLWLGILSGIILPFIVFTLVWQFKYAETDLVSYINNLKNIGVFLKVSSLCVATNLILFYPFLNTNRYLATRGVVTATLIYAVIIMFVVML